MHEDMEAWEDAEVARIWNDAEERARSLEAVQDFRRVMWKEVVEKPTDQAWTDFRLAKKAKSQELAEYAEQCFEEWKSFFTQWGVTRLRDSVPEPV